MTDKHVCVLWKGIPGIDPGKFQSPLSTSQEPTPTFQVVWESVGDRATQTERENMKNAIASYHNDVATKAGIKISSYLPEVPIRLLTLFLTTGIVEQDGKQYAVTVTPDISSKSALYPGQLDDFDSGTDGGQVDLLLHSLEAAESTGFVPMQIIQGGSLKPLGNRRAGKVSVKMIENLFPLLLGLQVQDILSPIRLSGSGCEEIRHMAALLLGLKILYGDLKTKESMCRLLKNIVQAKTEDCMGILNTLRLGSLADLARTLALSFSSATMVYLSCADGRRRLMRAKIDFLQMPLPRNVADLSAYTSNDQPFVPHCHVAIIHTDLHGPETNEFVRNHGFQKQDMESKSLTSSVKDFLTHQVITWCNQESDWTDESNAGLKTAISKLYLNMISMMEHAGKSNVQIANLLPRCTTKGNLTEDAAKVTKMLKKMEKGDFGNQHIKYPKNVRWVVSTIVPFFWCFANNNQKVEEVASLLLAVLDQEGMMPDCRLIKLTNFDPIHKRWTIAFAVREAVASWLFNQLQTQRDWNKRREYYMEVFVRRGIATIPTLQLISHFGCSLPTLSKNEFFDELDDIKKKLWSSMPAFVTALLNQVNGTGPLQLGVELTKWMEETPKKPSIKSGNPPPFLLKTSTGTEHTLQSIIDQMLQGQHTTILTSINQCMSRKTAQKTAQRSQKATLEAQAGKPMLSPDSGAGKHSQASETSTPSTPQEQIEALSPSTPESCGFIHNEALDTDRDASSPTSKEASTTFHSNAEDVKASLVHLHTNHSNFFKRERYKDALAKLAKDPYAVIELLLESIYDNLDGDSLTPRKLHTGDGQSPPRPSDPRRVSAESGQCYAYYNPQKNDETSTEPGTSEDDEDHTNTQNMDSSSISEAPADQLELTPQGRNLRQSNDNNGDSIPQSIVLCPQQGTPHMSPQAVEPGKRKLRPNRVRADGEKAMGDTIAMNFDSIDSLEPHAWLESSIVFFWMSHLKKHHGANCMIIDPFILHDVKVRHVSSWTMDQIGNAFLVFPYCTKSHWQLGILCNPSSASPFIVFLDSMPTIERPASNLAGLIRTWLQIYRKRDLPKLLPHEVNTNSCPVFVPKVASQNDCYNCGIYICHYVEQMVKQSSACIVTGNPKPCDPILTSAFWDIKTTVPLYDFLQDCRDKIRQASIEYLQHRGVVPSIGEPSRDGYLQQRGVVPSIGEHLRDETTDSFVSEATFAPEGATGVVPSIGEPSRDETTDSFSESTFPPPLPPRPPPTGSGTTTSKPSTGATGLPKDRPSKKARTSDEEENVPPYWFNGGRETLIPSPSEPSPLFTNLIGGTFSSPIAFIPQSQQKTKTPKKPRT
jgi:hypothetical protein